MAVVASSRPTRWRDTQLDRSLGSSASLRDQLRLRLNRNAWLYSKEEIQDLTRRSKSTKHPDGDVLVVRAHTRRGTPPLVRSVMADHSLYVVGDVYRGSSQNPEFLASLAYIQHLVRIIRPSDWADAEGALMRNEHAHLYVSGDTSGETIAWHRGQFVTVEKTGESMSLLWSTRVTLRGLLKSLRTRKLIDLTTPIEYETDSVHDEPRIEHEGTVRDLEHMVASDESRVASITVPLTGDQVELWWEEPAGQDRAAFATLAAVWSSRSAAHEVIGYVEATGTTDVKHRARKALEARGLV